MDVETCVAPAEDLLHQRKADELFPEKQREDLVGEDFLDNLVMETTNMMESAIRSCASFANQDVDMRVEVDAIAESLDYGHYSLHDLKACGCVQKFHKCTHRRETEIIEELSLEQKLVVQSGTPKGAIPYTVQSDDTPYKIAKKYGMDLNYLLSLNGLSTRSKIYPGQQLLVTANK